MHEDNLVERLRSHAASRPDRVALRFIEGDDVAGELTFADFDARIRSVAATLQQFGASGDRALILLPSGFNYAVAFYACLYSGVIAVPAYPPEGGAQRYARRLNGILRDATPRFILTETALRGAVEALLANRRDIHLIEVDTARAELAANWREARFDEDAIAFLQYTSGSTSQPKGVCVSHGNLAANERAMQAIFDGTPDDVFVSWLPLYHDMGLIGGLLNPLFTGFTAVLMSPRNFFERPRRWLEAIDRHGGSISGGPDFAFSLCADRISDETLAKLDLRRWRFAFSGSEFVRRSTLQRFAERFRPAGFDRRALTACYGLAEATLLVTAGEPAKEPVSHTFDISELAAGRVASSGEGTALVACGRPPADHAVRIMRKDGSGAAKADEVGEIWAAGPSIALGYWNNEEATRSAFVERDGRRWLRTGDLGFMRDDALVVAGRLKDLLIVRGQNIYPTDIEEAVETEVPAVRRGRVAAFPVEIDGQEGIGVAAEFSRAVLKRTAPEALAHAIGEAVVRQAQKYPAVIVLLNPQAMPLTTSGKLQRSACSAGWANNTIDSFMVFERGRRRDGAALPDRSTAPSTDTERAVASIWCEALGVQPIGREDDFFVLGGNSITAGQVAAAIRERLGVELELRSFFDAPTLGGFAERVDAVMRDGAGRVLPPIKQASPDDRTVLSHAQERLWFLWNMDPGGTAYTVASTIRLNGKLDHTLLSRAIAEIVQRHEVLRTTFTAKDGQGRQVVHGTMNVAIRHEDLRRFAPEQAGHAAELTRTELEKPFDLIEGPLLRAVLLQFSDHEHELLLLAHHIVVDGWSLNVLLEELAGLYCSFIHDDAGTPPAPEIQYADFAAWQRSWLASGEAARQLAYWRTRLGETHPVLALPHDRPRPSTQSHGGDTIGLEIDGALAARLRGIAKQRRASVFMLLLGAYQALLYRYSGQSDLRVGVPVAGRRHARLERLIGCFVNTLVVRAEIEHRTTFLDLLEQVREAVIAALSHQDLPFELLVDALRPERSGGHNPLFQAKFNYMTAPRGFDGVEGLSAETRIVDLAGSHFDLALDIVDGAEGMKATFNFATDLFDSGTISRIASQFGSLLRQIAENADRPLSDFAIDETNRQRVPSQTEAFGFADLVSLYHAASADHEAAIALRCGSKALTFAELESKSNRIAWMLAARGVTREVPVGLWIERSLAFVIALLGVLKAGGAYVPLDPKWPLERVRRILEDGNIKTVIAVGDTLASTSALGCAVLDANDDATFESASNAPLKIAISPAQTAYVIYTSGSTGAPKGVAVSHGALANYVQALLRRLQPAPGASMAMVSTVAADLGHTVLFGALAAGATLHLLPPEAAFDADLFARAMRDGEVGILKIVPSHLRGLLQASRSADLLPRDVLILGGEACNAALLAEIRQLRPQCRILNHYGPTETTVGAVTHECEPERTAGPIPIGLPLANLRAHVLDDALNEAPIGVTGELYIGGAGLARGYRGEPGLTAERFVPDPFGPPGERLYRTGDVVRCDPSGRLIFLGRGDDQIKLRGYRVELGEVTRAVKAQERIEDAVVVARAIGAGHERQELVAYCVRASGATLQPETIKERLADLMPDYMVPSRIVVLDRLPLTPNGKVDRGALPGPDEDTVVAAYSVPVGEIEQAIATVWRDVLGREQIGRHDNFFELGGDSILSLQIISRLRKRGIRLTPKQVFAQQTVAALAGVATVTAGPATKKGKAKAKAEASAGGDLVSGIHHLLPIQLRFFEDDIGDRDHWNQSVLLVPRSRLDWDVLRRALAAVVDHHDALRLRFEQADGAWRAEYAAAPAPSDLLSVHAKAIDAAQVTAIASAAQVGLSLSSGPLLRAVGMEITDGGQRLLIAIHHLVVDGVSWRVLLEDIASAYEQLKQGAGAVTLAPKSDSFASWGARLKAYATTPELAAELAFWLASGATTDLRCDDDHGGIDRVSDREEVLLAFDADLTSRLLGEAPSAYRTQVNDLLLATLARAVWRWSGLDKMTVELEGHGREDIFPGAEISRTVGWFTTAFPLRLEAASSDDAALIKLVKERIRSVPNRGLGYGVLRYLGEEEHRKALSRLPEPRIVFNYLGRFDRSVGEASCFGIAPESGGSTRSANAPLRGWLNINGEVREGRLRLSFGYGSRRYRRETVERLARSYQAALRELVDHCTSGACGLTPSDVPLSGLGQADLDRLGTTLDWRNVEDIYPLSPMQQGMLFHALRDGDDDVYVNQIGLEVLDVDPARLRAAWQAVSDRHAALRTGFVWQNLSGSAQQVVYRQVAVPFVEEDWRGIAELARNGKPSELDAALAEASRRERDGGLNLSRPPLQRVRLIRLDDNRYWLIWTHHHIFLDGWSSARLVAEVLQLVNGGMLPAVQGSYRDYIAWLQSRDHKASATFWHHALAALETPTLLADALASDVAAPDASGHARLTLTVDRELTERLKTFAMRERITLNTLVQGAWAQLLRQHVGQSAVCFGVTVSGRPAELAGSEEMVGLFINTLPIVDEANPQTPVGVWLRRLQEQNLALREHGWTPLYEIQRLAGHAGRALFDSILVFENYPIDQALLGESGAGPRLGQVEHITPTNYALAVAVFAGPDALNLEFNYDRSRFDSARLALLRDSLRSLLQRIAESTERPLGDLGSTDNEETRRILDWSGRAALARAASETSRRSSSPLSFSVVAQIEKRAKQSPAAVALICGDEQISYREMNIRANRLAWRLRRHGIGPDRLVGLALARGPELIVALLATLKAGAAYLPLDPDYPSERLVHMLGDSAATLILTQGALRDHLAPVLRKTGIEAWRLDELEPSGKDDIGNLEIEIHPDSLAYVIYTSGSTGLPKGVAVAHGPLAMHCDAIGLLYGMNPGDREFHSASISFDIAHERWLVPLMTGGALVMPPTRDLLIDDLLREIEARSVSTVFMPPAYADQLSEALRQRDRKLALRLCIVGGEAWSDVGVKAFRRTTDVGLLINAYGPTETVIAPMAWMVDEAALTPGRYAPIGRPVGLRSAYILDGDLNVAPVGVTGELFIGGRGLARGYLNRSKLTAERFIPDPFGSGERLYRTGDLARWRAVGVIEYVGRSDHQVKIRGFRIELGEIEARLLEQYGVRSAVVVTHEAAGGRQLIGYVSGGPELDGRALRERLSGILPNYMVPPLIVVLDQLPLTPNGKIDRKALPAPQDGVVARRGYTEPEGEIETALAKIWAELLGLERVGRVDHFFELGGHSLLAVRLLSRVSQELGVSVQLSDLFRHPELAEFARTVSIGLIEGEFDAGELQELIAAGI